MQSYEVPQNFAPEVVKNTPLKEKIHWALVIPYKLAVMKYHELILYMQILRGGVLSPNDSPPSSSILK